MSVFFSCHIAGSDNLVDYANPAIANYSSALSLIQPAREL